MPYNYIFEVYPVLQKRKSLTVDKNDAFLGIESKWKNFIFSEALMKYRAFLYLFVGVFVHISGIAAKLIRFDANGVLLILTGGVYLKLWLKYELEGLYE